MDNVTCIQQWELANLGSRVEERLFTVNLVVLLNLNHVLFNQNMKTQTLNFVVLNTTQNTVRFFLKKEKNSTKPILFRFAINFRKKQLKVAKSGDSSN